MDSAKSESPIHVVGIGLDGMSGLSAASQRHVNAATLLVGGDRHLSYLPDHPATKVLLGNIRDAFAAIRGHLQAGSPQPDRPIKVVILTSGDPLFFGLGRLLLSEFAADEITFHPHLSSVQLAFSRIKIPWNDARVVSAHGRPLDELAAVIQQNAEKLAILTDKNNTPQAIAQLIEALDCSQDYGLWVCENLGSADEQITAYSVSELAHLSSAQPISPLNLVVAVRSSSWNPQSYSAQASLATDQTRAQHDVTRLPKIAESIPALGISDSQFVSFSDRPGLMTKREIRILALGELALQPNQTIWDIGAGTGSVSIEAARLCPSSHVYAIEKTTAGFQLIYNNMQRFQTQNITPIHGEAPAALETLPKPHRIFVGGSGSRLEAILTACCQQIQPGGTLVMAIATLEHLAIALDWLQHSRPVSRIDSHRVLSCQLSRSIPVGTLTRLTPLNPVNLLTINFKNATN